MKSRVNARFWKHYRRLPASVRKQAKEAYKLFAENPQHPGLLFKQLFKTVYSVRIGIHYRALGTVADDTIIWFWIGTHAEYDALVKQLRKG